MKKLFTIICCVSTLTPATAITSACPTQNGNSVVLDNVPHVITSGLHIFQGTYCPTGYTKLADVTNCDDVYYHSSGVYSCLLYQWSGRDQTGNYDFINGCPWTE